MGRTYKRNDTYRSNRPKSLREKRSTRSKSKYEQFDDNLSTPRYNKPQRPNVQEFDNGDDYNG